MLLSLFFIIVISRHIVVSSGILWTSVQLSCSVMSDSLRPHGPEPTRLLCLWDSLGKNTGVGSIQFSHSVVSDSLQPHGQWTAACQASLSITNSWSPPKLMSIELVKPSSHLILCHPLLLLPPIPPSIRVFSNESALRMKWPKSWSFSISPSNEHPGLISFRMECLHLLAVQGTLKSFLQHHNSKHQFFGAQLSSQSNSHIHT